MILYLVVEIFVTFFISDASRIVFENGISYYSTSKSECEWHECTKWDLAFVVTLSNRTTPHQFELIKEFILSVAMNCPLNQNDSRVSLVVAYGPLFCQNDCFSVSENANSSRVVGIPPVEVHKGWPIVCSCSEDSKMVNFLMTFAVYSLINDNDRLNETVGRTVYLIADYIPTSLVPYPVPDHITPQVVFIDVNKSVAKTEYSRNFAKKNQIFVVSNVFELFSLVSTVSPCPDAFKPRSTPEPESSTQTRQTDLSTPYYVQPTTEPTQLVHVILEYVVPSAIIVIFVINLLYCFIRQHWANKRIQRWNTIQERVQWSTQRKETVPKTSENSDLWELSRQQLLVLFDEKLGSGAFGDVYKGKLEGKCQISLHKSSVSFCKSCESEVAVKVLPEFADRYAKSDFLQEINCMKQIGYCEYLVNMVGCVTSSDGPFLLAVQFCSKGDLLKFLRKFKKDSAEPGLTVKQMVSFAWQISTAMCYLSSKGFIHRDLAARNVLLDVDLRAKVGDFGMCRVSDAASCYVSQGGRLPVKWMAPESLRHFEFTFKTDVWSFGVVMWEMFTYGDVPFGFVEPREMQNYLAGGNRLEKPNNCSDQIYEIMMSCWNENCEQRPAFDCLRQKLSILLEDDADNYGYLEIENDN